LSKSGNIPPKAQKVLGISKGQKVLGIGTGPQAKKPTGLAAAAKKITGALKPGAAKPGAAPKASGFTPATTKSTNRLTPASPVIGTRGKQGVHGGTIEKQRMNDRLKKAGLGGI
jgi:hypothetical protein